MGKLKKLIKKGKNLASDLVKVAVNQTLAPARAIGIKKAKIPPSKFHNQKFGKFTSKVSDVVAKTTLAVGVTALTGGAAGGALASTLAVSPTVSSVVRNKELISGIGKVAKVSKVLEKIPSGGAPRRANNSLIKKVTDIVAPALDKGKQKQVIAELINDTVKHDIIKGGTKEDSTPPEKSKGIIEMILDIPISILNAVFK